MSDNYPLTSLYLYLTSTCNLRCSHCWISPRFSRGKQDGIPFEPLKKTIQDAKTLGLQCVKLTGGEPLLYQNLNELLTFLSLEELSISIETNGTLVDENLVAAFKAAAVTQISVSLDAAGDKVHDEIRGVPGSFYRTLEGLKCFSGSGLNFQIIMTLQRKNKDEIPGMIALCERLNAGSLKINHLLPCGRGKEAFHRGDNLVFEELNALYLKVKEQGRPSENLDVFFDIPVAFRSIEDITVKGICECDILSILGILATGDYSICGIGQTVPELRMGNICRNSIRDIWKNSTILQDLRKSLPSKLSGICGDCIFKFQCLGCCRANAYAVSGNLYAPYFLCQSSYENSCFPESRCLAEETTQ